jgi:hypothetical protein
LLRFKRPERCALIASCVTISLGICLTQPAFEPKPIMCTLRVHCWPESHGGSHQRTRFVSARLIEEGLKVVGRPVSRSSKKRQMRPAVLGQPLLGIEQGVMDEPNTEKGSAKRRKEAKYTHRADIQGQLGSFSCGNEDVRRNLSGNLPQSAARLLFSLQANHSYASLSRESSDCLLVYPHWLMIHRYPLVFVALHQSACL